MVKRKQVPILEPYQLVNYLNKIDIVRDTETCWSWTGAKIPKSTGDFYGTFKNCRNGVQHQAHLWAYRYFVGPLELTKQINHKCFNKLCCNWINHLEETTPSQNQLWTKDLKFLPSEICNNGHPRTSENTYVDPRGWRECKICRSDASLAAYHRNKRR